MEQRRRTNMFFFNIMSGLYLTNNRGFPLYVLQFQMRIFQRSEAKGLLRSL